MIDQSLLDVSSFENQTEQNQRIPEGNFANRKCHLFKNTYMSDVNLIVTDKNSNGEEEMMEVIPAHKIILSLGSSIFEQTFLEPINWMAGLRVENISSDVLDTVLK